MPILELILNPFAGPVGFNLISVLFYIALAGCCFVAAVERSFKQ